MQETILDDFDDIADWSPITSGEARIDIGRDQGSDGGAMRLDVDFRGGGGFVGARKEFALDIPESYSFGVNIRGTIPANIFEFKLVDDTNQNVWRYRVEDFDFPADWQPLQIRSSQVVFAWGPLGGGPPENVAAIELVIAAGQGGAGTVRFEGLWFRDDTYRLTPRVSAASTLAGHEPQDALTSSAATSWQSEAGEGPQWLLIDFQQEREYGGLVVDWVEGLQARRFDVEVSVDGAAWKTAYATSQADAGRSYLYLPQTVSRYLRLNLYVSARGGGFGIRHITVEPYDFSRSLNHFFQYIAADEAAGMYPKYFLGRQTYWTVAGSGTGDSQALMNEEGQVEVDKGDFSIEPFLYADQRLVTWADVDLKQELVQSCLPIPCVKWQTGRLSLEITAFATGEAGRSVLYLCYRVANTAGKRQSLRLFTVLRPFQVTPPWQSWRSFGGASPIRELCFLDGTLWVNGKKPVIPLTEPSAFGAAAFAEDAVIRHLVKGEVPPRADIRDEFGYASGAMGFDLDLAPGANEEVYLAIPFGSLEAGIDARVAASLRGVSGPEQFERARRDWQARLGEVEMTLPARTTAVADTFRTAAAHILINRDGPALHPGPRRYSRSWIRDGAIMGAALLRAGHPAAIRDFIRWYAGFQAEDGDIPDCADQEGTEWLPEYDAYGQFIYAVVEYYRFTGDRGFLAEMQPAVAKTLDFMENLRAQRLTQEYRRPEKRACYGLLPESMSHEGYMAHPVHAYWDDFWAVRGLRDATFMADELDDPLEAARLASVAASFSKDLRASLRATIDRHRIAFLPGSVEFGDFDPAATSVAISLLNEAPLLPRQETRHTFDKYLTGLRQRTAGGAWNNYSAYEIRIIGALVRLGRRDEAIELMDFMLADRRILPWNQWPEISWRDPSSPSFIGDLPHSWISAEYILAICSLFAYEREEDQALVIAAGVALKWLADGSPVGVANLPTHYGRISFSLRMENADTLRLVIGGDLRVPPGGIVARPPLPRPVRQFLVKERPLAASAAGEFVCGECPAEIVILF
ncbi:MAG: discoidin domain-containing protein [Desulfobacterales bacterium]